MPNYIGYDYIAERLASYGYIVVSVSGNGVNVLGNQVSDTGMRQRGELLERAPRPVAEVEHDRRGPVRDQVRRARSTCRGSASWATRAAARAPSGRSSSTGSAPPVRHRRGPAARARGLHREDGQQHPDGGHAAVLRRRRVRPAGHALLRRRALQGPGRPDAQGHRHGHGRQPQLLQHGVDARRRVPGRVRRRPGRMSGTHHRRPAAQRRAQVTSSTSSDGTSEGRWGWTRCGPARRSRSASLR